MPDANALLSHLSVALSAAMQAACPVLIFVIAAAILVSVLQALIGFGDPAIGLAARLAGAAAAFVVFGHWTVNVVIAYWSWAWRAASNVLGAGP
ncbi:MAG: flagellar biosynthetic protein FliQ [Armatimonadetes bacterium]|nr:flagellar biosynthetic protein FliQ [Armatimonadota bacterium]